MSNRVKARLVQLELLANTDHELRVDLDRELEARYGEYCDKAIDRVSDAELRALVAMLQERRRRKKQGKTMTEEEERAVIAAYA